MFFGMYLQVHEMRQKAVSSVLLLYLIFATKYYTKEYQLNDLWLHFSRQDYSTGR